MKRNDVKAEVAIAVKACQEKKAEDISILRLDAASGLTDYFVICSGANPRQVEAIAEAVDEHLSKAGVEPVNIDGRRSEIWVALDYGDFMVHVFSESARKFYDLERLWKTASKVELAELLKPAAKKTVAKRAGAKVPRKPTLSAKNADKRGRKGK
ncbi:MAG TPA: ribosome silencing factor [Candidatus Methylomirabilis sp.]|nr:ribosome silencing factor [Candidatus Methylomirabilis sp.]